MEDGKTEMAVHFFGSPNRGAVDIFEKEGEVLEVAGQVVLSAVVSGRGKGKC